MYARSHDAPLGAEIMLFLLLAVGMVLFLSSCGGAGDDWYDQSRAVKELKKERMDELVAGGATPEEAGRQFGLEHAVQQTERGFSATVESEGP